MYCSLSDDSLLCNLERISAASLVLTGVHWACMYYHWELLCGHISDAFYSNFSLNLALSGTIIVQSLLHKVCSCNESSSVGIVSKYGASSSCGLPGP